MKGKKAFIGTIMSIVLITLAAVVFYIFFYQYYTYDKGVTFESIGDGQYFESVDDLDLILLSFLRTKVDDFSVIDHIRLGNENIVQSKAREAFEILCEANPKCYWVFDAQDFGIEIRGGNNIQQSLNEPRSVYVKIPVNENLLDDKKIRLLVYDD